jgi:hypothetical protein
LADRLQHDNPASRPTRDCAVDRVRPRRRDRKVRCIRSDAFRFSHSMIRWYADRWCLLAWIYPVVPAAKSQNHTLHERTTGGVCLRGHSIIRPLLFLPLPATSRHIHGPSLRYQSARRAKKSTAVSLIQQQATAAQIKPDELATHKRPTQHSARRRERSLYRRSKPSQLAPTAGQRNPN